MHLSDWNRRAVELDLYLTADPALSNVVYKPPSLNDDAACRAETLSFLAMVRNLIAAEPTIAENERLSKEQYDLIQTVRDRLYVFENNLVYDLFFSQKPDGLAFRALRIAKRIESSRTPITALSSPEKIIYALISTWRTRVIFTYPAFRSRLNNTFARRCFLQLELSSREVHQGALSQGEHVELMRLAVQECRAFAEFLDATKEKIGAPDIFYYQNWKVARSLTNATGWYDWKKDVAQDMIDAAERAPSVVELEAHVDHAMHVADQLETLRDQPRGLRKPKVDNKSERELAAEVVSESIMCAKMLCAVAVNRYLRAFYTPSEVERVQKLAERIDLLFREYEVAETRLDKQQAQERLERLFGLHIVTIDDGYAHGAYDWDVLE